MDPNDSQSQGDGAERREHERYEFTVQISMGQGGKMSELHAKNISAGGILIELEAGEYPGVQPGNEVSVHLDLGSDRYGRPLSLDVEAEVVRVDLGGPGRSPTFALMWTSTDSSVASQLAVILEYLHG